jgi:hypothetical protein
LLGGEWRRVVLFADAVEGVFGDAGHG